MLENWTTTCKRMQPEHFLILYTKIMSNGLKILSRETKHKPNTLWILQNSDHIWEVDILSWHQFYEVYVLYYTQFLTSFNLPKFEHTLHGTVFIINLGMSNIKWETIKSEISFKPYIWHYLIVYKHGNSIHQERIHFVLNKYAQVIEN